MRLRTCLNSLVAALAIFSIPCYGQITKITVGIADDLTQSSQMVDGVLTAGSAKLVLDPGKRKCGLRLALNDKLHKLKPGLGDIVNQDALKAVCQEGNTLNIVRRIDQCDKSEPLNMIQGCFYESCAVLVWDADRLENESLFLHEYAHTKNLKHVCGDDYLMNPVLSTGQFTVSYDECSQIKEVQSEEEDEEAYAPNSELSLNQPLKARNFVEKHYRHGVPFAEARRLSRVELDEIQKLLMENNDPSFIASADFKANAVLALGVAGDQRDEAAIMKVFTGPPTSNNSTTALSAAALALSYLEHRGYLSRLAMAELEKRVDPKFWKSAEPDLSDQQTRDLAVSAIRAVANFKSDQDKPQDFLKNLLLSNDPFFQAEKALIEASIDFNKIILPNLPI